MATTKKTLRTCPQGHQYYKSSNCPTCPVCQEQQKPEDGFMAQLSAPARRALQAAGITTLNQLAKYSEAEVLKLHGMGPASIPKLKSFLRLKNLTFAVK